MKRFMLALTIVSLVGLSGCFSKTETNNQKQDIPVSTTTESSSLTDSVGTEPTDDGVSNIAQNKDNDDTEASSPNKSDTTEDNTNVQKLEKNDTEKETTKKQPTESNSSAESTATSTLIKFGDKGNSVKTLQKNLNKFNYNLYEDGDFGNSTLMAVRDFQSRNNISVDGVVGPSTLEKLDLAPTKSTTYTAPTIGKGIDSSNFANKNNFASQTNYFIWIDTKANHTYVYSGSKNNWTILKDMLCTTGSSATPTIKGTFTIGDKGAYFDTDYGVRCKYWTRISGGYLFHTILYDKSGNVVDSRLGENLSHGCVRLSSENAQWIQNNIPSGTTVYIN